MTTAPALEKVACLADHLPDWVETTAAALLASIRASLGDETADAVKADLARWGSAKYYLADGLTRVKVVRL